MSTTSTDSEPGSLHAQGYDYLVEAICQGQLKPGDAVDRNQVAGTLGISVAPVHQAITQLQTEGLVISVPRRGTRVRVLDARSTAGYLVVREALERQAARLYAGGPIREARASMMEAAEALDTMEAGPQRARADSRFHRRLVGLAGVPELVSAFDRIALMSVLQEVDHLLASVGLDGRRHTKLLRDLGQATPEEAEALICDHVRSGRDVLFQMVEGRA
jgi:DNA-binding GntR family transcriptional regulator